MKNYTAGGRVVPKTDAVLFPYVTIEVFLRSRCQAVVILFCLSPLHIPLSHPFLRYEAQQEILVNPVGGDMIFALSPPPPLPSIRPERDAWYLTAVETYKTKRLASALVPRPPPSSVSRQAAAPAPEAPLVVLIRPGGPRRRTLLQIRL